jgi:hypothetical protein
LSASRKRSWATIDADMVSSTSPLRQIMRSWKEQMLGHFTVHRADLYRKSAIPLIIWKRYHLNPLLVWSKLIQGQQTYMCANRLPTVRVSQSSQYSNIRIGTHHCLGHKWCWRPTPCRDASRRDCAGQCGDGAGEGSRQYRLEGGATQPSQKDA